MKTPRIFISYNQADEAWKEDLLASLRVLERQGVAEIWSSTNVWPGDDWPSAIEKAIQQSDIGVLLVSPSFLGSDHIVGSELPRLLHRRRLGGMAILAIMVRPSIWEAVPDLAGLQFVNDPAMPLSSVSQNERDRIYQTVSRRIAELAQAIALGRETSDTPGAEIPAVGESSAGLGTGGASQGHVFISHSHADGDFAELAKLTLERGGYSAWVDTDRLMPGVDWQASIDQGIKTASAVLAVMSPDARASEYVTYEWAFALGAGTRVIPIMLRQTTVHPRLATLQYLDFTNRIARPWARLFSTLR